MANSKNTSSKKIKEQKESDDKTIITAKTTSKKGTKEKEVLGATESGAIGTAPAKKVATKPKTTTTKKATTAKKDETVAVFSTRNVSWDGVGKVEKGYNILSKEEADKWLTRSHTRLATPEEVAAEYRK